MRLRTFIANFVRQDTAESSTRLVGVLSFLLASALTTALVIVVVVAAWKGGADRKNLYDPSTALTTFMISMVTVLFANACIALGLRKRSADDTPDKAP